MLTTRSLALVAATLAVAACSGGSAASDTTAGATTTVAPSTTSAPSTTAATTTAAPSTSTTMTSTTEPADPFADWCAITVQARTQFGDDAEIDLTDPAEVQIYVEGITELAERATEVVPDEIAEAWAVSLEISRLSREAIEAADYDMLEADFSALAELADEEEQADAIIDAFNEEWCGIEPSPDDENDFDPSLGSLKEQFIGALTDAGFTDDEATCVFDNYDFAATDTTGEDEAIVAALDACEISPERLLEVVDESNR